MQRKYRSDRGDSRPLCAAPSSEDGADPRRFFRKSGHRAKPNRKTLQLCSQVAETLGQTLGGSEADDVLGELAVVSVSPTRDAAQLLVVLQPTLGAEPDAATVASQLAAAAGRLRAEVAAAITRRRTPKLMFQYQHAGESPVGESGAGKPNG